MEDHKKDMAVAGASENDADKSLNSEGKSAVVSVDPEKKKKRTVGNIIYDFGVFGSIAWAGVCAMSALTAHEAMHGNNKYFNWLRTLNNSVFSGLSKFLSKSVMKNSPKEIVDDVAKNTTMVFTLGMGGHTLMAPIKWLEDNRQKNAAKIDKLLGTEPPDSEVVAHEPKQSWGSVLSGRMLSWGIAFATVTAMGPKLIRKVNDNFSKAGVDAWMKFRPQSNTESVKKWSDIISFDVAFTAVTAFVTYAFSRFVAKKDEKEPDVGDNLYKLNPIAPNPLGDPEDELKNSANFTKNIKPERKISLEPHSSFIDRVHGEDSLGHARI